MKNQKKLLKKLKEFTESDMIKVDGQDKKRRIFKSKQVFEIFGAEEKEILNPFNDYTYEWLHSFLCLVEDTLKADEFDNLGELHEKISDNIPEWVDSEVDVYTANLTAWLANNNTNTYYLDEAVKEGVTDNLLGVAQYKAIEELYWNALRCLTEWYEGGLE